VIYELHVRGFTMRHPQVPPELQGTYAGLATAPVIEHLRRLGVTTVELMPVHAFVDDRLLLEKGLRNYWGYNTIGFFAPEMRYSQTLVGSWPHEPADDTTLASYRERIERYMVKAAREAKLRTSWINAGEAYEEALVQFVRAALEPREANLFLADFLPRQARVAHFGALNSLSQTLLRLTAPGVPDIYRGTELFELSLVDPDNRRPVDYALRARLLAEIESWSLLDPQDFAARVLDESCIVTIAPRRSPTFPSRCWSAANRAAALRNPPRRRASPRAPCRARSRAPQRGDRPLPRSTRGDPEPNPHRAPLSRRLRPRVRPAI
jgi:hypothetical protein